MDYSEIVVRGRPSGDSECWCLDVTEEEYRKILGEENYQNEKEWDEKHIEEIPEREEQIRNKQWRIYPSDLIPFDDKDLEITIIVKKVSE